MGEYLVSIPSKEVSDMNRKELLAFLSVYLNIEFNYKKIFSTKDAKQKQIQDDANQRINIVNEEYKRFEYIEANQDQLKIQPELESLREEKKNIKPISSKKIVLISSLVTGIIFIGINHLMQIWEWYESKQFAAKVPLFDRSSETAGARFRMDVVYTVVGMWRDYNVFLFFLLVIGVYLFIKLREEAKKNKLNQTIETLEKEALTADQEKNAIRDFSKEFHKEEKHQVICNQRDTLLTDLEVITNQPIEQSIDWYNQLSPILPPSMQNDDYDTLKRLTYIYQILEDQRASNWEKAFQILREEERHQENLNMMTNCYLSLSQQLTELEQNIGYLDEAVLKNNQRTGEVLRNLKNFRVVYQ